MECVDFVLSGLDRHDGRYRRTTIHLFHVNKFLPAEDHDVVAAFVVCALVVVVLFGGNPFCVTLGGKAQDKK